MKKILCLLVILFMLAGCGGGNSSSDNAPAKREVNLQITADIMSMDPQIATDGQSFTAQNLCFAGLTVLDADGVPQPDGAESWTVSDDGCVYTFKLRDNYWSNGDKVTANDYVFGWQRLVDPETASDYQWLLETACVKNAEAYDPETGLKPTDLGVKAIDDNTLEVTLNNPTPLFLQIVSFPSTYPCNQKFYESLGNQYALSVDNLLSCGPYIMTSWDGGYGYSFEFNDKYYDYENYKDKYAEKVNFRIVSDPQSALMEYEQGGLDYVSLSGSQVAANSKNEDFQTRAGSYSFYLIININYIKDGKNKATANENVRKAMMYAIDREDICKNMADGSTPDKGLVPAGFAFSAETTHDFRDDAPVLVAFDQAKAKEYFEAAKKELGTDKVTLDLMYSSDQGDPEIIAATRIASQLEEIGFEVTLNAQPKKSRLNVYQHVNEDNTADFEVSLTRWGPDYADPQTYMDLFISSNKGNNNGGYMSDEYDALIEKAEAADTSYADRWNCFIEAEKVLVEKDAAVVPIFQNGFSCMVKKNVTGFEYHSGSIDVYRHIVVE